MNQPSTAPAANNPVFSNDQASGPDFLGNESTALQFAELIAHTATATPITIGLFGASGAGKSHVLERVLTTARALADAARTTSGPYLSKIATIRLSAPDLITHPISSLAAQIFERLGNSTADAASSEVARDAVHASIDPQAAAREAAERLDEARRRLDAERRALTELDGRRARLIETVLYESAGSSVDGYARSNRTRIEPRLRIFGFTGDPVQTYKDLVRDYAERSGGFERVGTFLRSLWAYEGQTALVVWTILFFLLAWALGYAGETQTVWLQTLSNSAEGMVPVATWLRQHVSWLATLRTGALIIAVLCLATNLWRAIRFLTPLMRGAKLLRTDIDSRRGEIDGQLSHQTRRVDMLAGEVDVESKRLADAERRAREVGPKSAAMGRDARFMPTGGREAEIQSQTFLQALSHRLGGSAQGPMRLVIAIDDLELVPPQAAATILETAHRLLSLPNLALIICANPAHLAEAWGSASTIARNFERIVQIPFSIDAGTSQESLKLYARSVLQPTVRTSMAVTADASRSSLDEAMSAEEMELLAELAPIAGSNPRAVKRFINIYRVARTRTPERAALALMLALDLAGTSGELAALGAAMDEHAPESEIHVHPGEPRLSAALQSVARLQGHNLTVGSAQNAWHIARDYRIPL